MKIKKTHAKLQRVVYEFDVGEVRYALEKQHKINPNRDGIVEFDLHDEGATLTVSYEHKEVEPVDTGAP